MWVVSRVVTGGMLAAFALVCVAASPVILFKFGVDAAGDAIERRWPDSARAAAARFWMRLLAPIAFVGVLLVGMALAVAWLKAKRGV